jgi:hypothetical protein
MPDDWKVEVSWLLQAQVDARYAVEVILHTGYREKTLREFKERFQAIDWAKSWCADRGLEYHEDYQAMFDVLWLRPTQID